VSESPFKPHFFERVDESDDASFYTEPRLVAHIDDAAIAEVTSLYEALLPRRATVLDLMSSYLSHMPPGLEWTRLAGLGMNAREMEENRQLSDFVVHDLNAVTRLPYDDETFDACVVTVSVQYMTTPVETFREVARVLKPGGPFVVTYSNRMFPTKAVRIWCALNDRERAGLIATYFKHAGAYDDVTAEDRSPRGASGDPLYAVWARKRMD
jgi:SAM-dependent methyltransferase